MRAWLYRNGSVTDLGTLGGSASGTNAINNSGQIVGWSYTAEAPLASMRLSGMADR